MVACWPRQGAVHPRHAITCVKDGRRARLPGDAALAGDADWPRRCETPGFFITVYERLSSASCVDARATHGRSLSLGHFRGLGFGLGVWAVWCTVTTQRLPSVSSSCNTSLPSAAVSTEDWFMTPPRVGTALSNACGFSSTDLSQTRVETRVCFDKSDWFPCSWMPTRKAGARSRDRWWTLRSVDA